MSEQIQAISDADFDEKTLNAEKPVIVDFWAPWCGPCKAIAPMLDLIEAEKGDRVHIFKCNVDVNPGTATRYGIKSIPTLLFFNQGELVDQVVGMTTRSRIDDTLDKLLNGEGVAAPFRMA
ncbi:MAG: thioredoxin [Desulfosarcinaceae bacterium]|jgi:thioredoxin 1